MASGRTGFGLAQVDPRATDQHVSKQELAAAAGDTTALLQLIEQHLARIEERYVEPANFSPQQISIPGSATQFATRLDFSTQPHNAFIVSVMSGTLNLFVGDYSGMAQATNPHMQFLSGTNQQVFIPLQGRVYTIINPSTTVLLLACFTPVAL